MGSRISLRPLIELFHQALSAQAEGGAHPPSHLVEAIHQHLQALLEVESPLILSSSKGMLWHQGEAIKQSPAATQSLVKEMEKRGFTGLAFYAGMDFEELELCVFVLQLPVRRLIEMGGVQALTPAHSNISFLGATPTKLESGDRAWKHWAPHSDQIGAFNPNQI